MNFYNMVSEFWKKQRTEFWPNITDWSGPHNELRKCPDKDWFTIMFFDIRIYALIQYAFPSQLIVLGLVFMLRWWGSPGVIVGLFLVLYFGWNLRNVIITHNMWYGTNLYDMLLRD